jgi:hypothetical protein
MLATAPAATPVAGSLAVVGTRLSALQTYFRLNPAADNTPIVLDRYAATLQYA